MSKPRNTPLKPATPLPWLLSSSLLVCDKDARVVSNITPMDVVGVTAEECFKNAPYIVHACNAYPRLVALVQRILNDGTAKLSDDAFDLLQELGERTDG